MTGPVTVGAEVALPWDGRDDSSCFGCARSNPIGLGLRFRHDGPDDPDDAGGPHDPGGIVTDLRLDRRYESYPGVVHGGIVALICDEAMGNLVVLRHGTPAVTTSLRVRYVTVVTTGALHRCHARVSGAPSGPLAGRAEIRDADGDLVATATATYHPVPADDRGLPVSTSTS